MSNREADLVKDDFVIKGQRDFLKLNGMQRLFRAHENASISLLKKKPKARIRIFDVTTACVVERPTPTVPPWVLRPARQPTPAMKSPKTGGLKNPPIISL